MRVALIRTGNILKVGLKAILRNKMRSSLTMLGIIIGVGCVITMVAVATGASRSVQARTRKVSATGAFVTRSLAPVRTHRSPFFSAVVDRPERSDPASASVQARAPMVSPEEKVSTCSPDNDMDVPVLAERRISAYSHGQDERRDRARATAVSRLSRIG